MDTTELANADMGSTFKMVLIYVDENDQPTSSPEAKEQEPEPVSNPPARVRRPFDELPGATQAGMRCNETDFQQFLKETQYQRWKLYSYDDDAERATQIVRTLCGVTTRADIKAGTPPFVRWRAILTDFQNWQRDVAS